MIDEKLQEREELSKEEEAVFYGQVVKALEEFLRKNDGRKPDRIKVHPRLYYQLVPFEAMITDQPIRCFTIPVEPEIGVTYGTFVFESEQTGIVRGH